MTKLRNWNWSNLYYQLVYYEDVFSVDTAAEQRGQPQQRHGHQRERGQRELRGRAGVRVTLRGGLPAHTLLLEPGIVTTILYSCHTINLVLFYPTSTTHVIILLLGFNCSQKFEAVIVVLVNYYAVRN